ncbi:30S ribosomal protein S21 [bacterium]|nr:30S ribosomal protein S21 [bacterium]
MTEVKIREHESIDEALRRFKRECERAGLMTEIKRREYYESPSVRKKRKIAEAKSKQKRKEVKFLSRLKRKR